jgi:hypothetical protein
LFQPGKQEIGNKEASKKGKRIIDQQVSKPMQLKKMVIRYRMSFVHTAKESFLMTYKERYGYNASCARTGAMKNMQGHTRTNSYAITAFGTNRI